MTATIMVFFVLGADQILEDAILTPDILINMIQDLHLEIDLLQDLYLR